MKLKIPAYKQPKKSMLCGHYAVKMLLEYYGIKKSIKEILKGIRIYKDGAYLGEIGSYFIDNGFKAELFATDTTYFPPEARRTNQKKLMERLKKHKPKNFKHKREVAKMIEFMEKGGKLTVRLPTPKTLRKEFEKGPFIAMIERKALYSFSGDTPGKHFHFVVVSGIEKNKVFLNDPQQKKVLSYPFEDFFYAWSDCDGYSLRVQPRW